MVDQATIKDLHPANYEDVRFSELKSHLRYSGSFRLRLRRPSRSPGHSRPYVPSDPIRLIDWKVFARTDQVLVREEHDESSARVLVCIDNTKTMDWPRAESVGAYGPRGPSKLEIGLRMAMNISFIHFRAADFVKLVLWDDEAKKPQVSVPMRAGSDVLTAFSQLEKEEFCLANMAKEEFAFSGKKFDIVYWISDGLYPKRAKWVFQNSYKTKILHCLSKNELDTSWLKADHCYFDFSGKKREYLGSVMQDHDAYHKAIHKWRDQYEESIVRQGGIYRLLTEDTSIRQFHRMLTEHGRK